MAYSGTWDQSQTTTGPQIRKPNTSMYGAQTPSQTQSPTTNYDARSPSGAGMYSSANSGGMGGGVFGSDLPSGGSLSIGDMQFQRGNEVPLEQTKLTTASQDYGNRLGLVGTGLQTRAQTDVANTQIQPAMEKLKLQGGTYFPELMKMFAANGLGGGNSRMNSLISGVSNSADPAYRNAAINAAEADSRRAQEQGLLNQYGQLGSANSPQAIAARQMAAASQAGGFQNAKRNIDADTAQRNIANLGAAVSAQNSSMAPLYSLFGSLLG